MVVVMLLRRLLPIALILSALCFGAIRAGAEGLDGHPAYAIARIPTPVLNTSGFASVFGGADGLTLKMNAHGEIKELETIALPGTVFKIEGTIQNRHSLIYRVTTEDYPYPAQTGYYIDSRFVKQCTERPASRIKAMPGKRAMMQRLLPALHLPYCWGGNCLNGVGEMMEYYPPVSEDLTQGFIDKWTLHGVDCSGLLYYLTDGYTPRNTDTLVYFGRAVPIVGLSVDEIADIIRPLDLIVWKGHVSIVLNPDEVVESQLDYEPQTPGLQGGVRVRPLTEVLHETVFTKGRTPVNDFDTGAAVWNKVFVVRRWFRE